MVDSWAKRRKSQDNFVNIDKPCLICGTQIKRTLNLRTTSVPKYCKKACANIGIKSIKGIGKTAPSTVRKGGVAFGVVTEMLYLIKDHKEPLTTTEIIQIYKNHAPKPSKKARITPTRLSNALLRGSNDNIERHYERPDLNPKKRGLGMEKSESPMFKVKRGNCAEDWFLREYLYPEEFSAEVRGLNCLYCGSPIIKNYWGKKKKPLTCKECNQNSHVHLTTRFIYKGFTFTTLLKTLHLLKNNPQIPLKEIMHWGKRNKFLRKTENISPHNLEKVFKIAIKPETYKINTDKTVSFIKGKYGIDWIRADKLKKIFPLDYINYKQKEIREQEAESLSPPILCGMCGDEYKLTKNRKLRPVLCPSCRGASKKRMGSKFFTRGITLKTALEFMKTARHNHNLNPTGIMMLTKENTFVKSKNIVPPVKLSTLFKVVLKPDVLRQNDGALEIISGECGFDWIKEDKLIPFFEEDYIKQRTIKEAENNNQRIKRVGLAKHRHDLPVDEYVFEEIVHNNGFAELILTGLRAQARYWMNRNLPGVDKLELFITGFTPALTAFIIEWNKAEPDCELILMHYDNSSGDYVAQTYEAEEWVPSNEEYNIIYSFALQNTLEHGEAQMGSIMGRMPEYFNMREVGRYLTTFVQEAVRDANQLYEQGGTTQVEKELQKINPELMERLKPKKKVTIKREFPDLPNVEEGNFKVRFAPNPNAPLTVGHMRGVLINKYYANKYGGEFILRFDDTSTDIKPPLKEGYNMILDDIKWLTDAPPDEIYIASERLPIYYDYAVQLIKKNGAYACSCEGKVFKGLKDKGIACPHRNQSIEENLKIFGDMERGNYAAGKMVLRAKTDLAAPNPAHRDFVIFRIQKNPHPRVDDRFVLWPMLDFQSAIDDHLTEVTHIIRGIDLMDSTRKQKLLYNVFGWTYPETTYWGRVNILDQEGNEIKFSSSLYAKGVKDGTYSGWDDSQLYTVQGMKKKGYVPEALLKWWLEYGLTQKPITVSLKTLDTLNRRVIESKEAEFEFIDIQDMTEEEREILKRIENKELTICETCDIIFPYISQKRYCDECNRKTRNRNRTGEARRKYNRKKREYDRKRYANMTDGEREEKNRKQRERYAQKKEMGAEEKVPQDKQIEVIKYLYDYVGPGVTKYEGPYALTDDGIAENLNKSRSFISNILKSLKQENIVVISKKHIRDLPNPRKGWNPKRNIYQLNYNFIMDLSHKLNWRAEDFLDFKMFLDWDRGVGEGGEEVEFSDDEEKDIIEYLSFVILTKIKNKEFSICETCDNIFPYTHGLKRFCEECKRKRRNPYCYIMTKEERQEKRRKNREYQRERAATMRNEEREEYNRNQRELMRERRANMTDEEQDERSRKDRERRAKKKEMEVEDEGEEILIHGSPISPLHLKPRNLLFPSNQNEDTDAIVDYPVVSFTPYATSAAAFAFIGRDEDHEGIHVWDDKGNYHIYASKLGRPLKKLPNKVAYLYIGNKKELMGKYNYIQVTPDSRAFHLGEVAFIEPILLKDLIVEKVHLKDFPEIKIHKKKESIDKVMRDLGLEVYGADDVYSFKSS